MDYMSKSGRITIKDLAERAGMSKTTVSFAFNCPERISTETYQRIMDIAREVGYSPDPVARTLAKRRTHALAILFPQTISSVFQNPYITEILRGFGDVCEKEGFTTTLMSPLKGIVSHTILNAAVDGIAFLGVTSDSDINSVCRQRDMPYVTIDAEFSTDYINIGIDDQVYAKKLAELLLKNGHRKICVCSLPAISKSLTKEVFSKTMEARRRGIHEAVQEICAESLPDLRFVEIEPSYIQSYEAAMQILCSNNPPTAVYCMADIQAYGFYSAAKELALSIPNDISVVTFDNLPHTDILQPKPSAVNQPGFEKGRMAAEILIDLLDGKPRRSIVLPTDIYESDSIASI